MTLEKNSPTSPTLLSQNEMASIIEKVLIEGDLSKLSSADRVKYYHAKCQSVGLNPLSQPFEYIPLQGKLILYIKKEGTEQLRAMNNINITDVTVHIDKELGLIRATAYANDGKGRSDVSTGIVSLYGTTKEGKTYELKNEALANAIMKAETKAKRRVTLSIAGLGLPDESEIEDMGKAQVYENHAEAYGLKRKPIDVLKYINEKFTQTKTLIEQAENQKELKQVYSQGWRVLENLKDEGEAKKSMDSLHKAYLAKRDTLALTVDEKKDETTVSNS